MVSLLRRVRFRRPAPQPAEICAAATRRDSPQPIEAAAQTTCNPRVRRERWRKSPGAGALASGEARDADDPRRRRAEVPPGPIGHASIRTTYDDYGHLFPNANRAVLKAFDELTRPICPTIAPDLPEEQLNLDSEIVRFPGTSADGGGWDRTSDLPRV